MSHEFGILAALAAPFVMTLGFIVWDNHWTGSAFALNMFKCNTASLGFLILSLTTRQGKLFPSDLFTRQNVGFLMLSSTIGILIGDWTWLEGLRLLGARRVIVVDSCKPFLAAFFGWALLDERLTGAHFGGMALTVVGVLIVSLEKEMIEEEPSVEGESVDDGLDDNEGNEVKRDPRIEIDDATEADSIPTGYSESQDAAIIDETRASSIKIKLSVDATRSLPCQTNDVPDTSDGKAQQTQIAKNRSRQRPRSRFRKGYMLALVNVVLDTYGSLLTKEYGEGMTTWEINLIRFGFAGACMLGLSSTLQVRQHLLSDTKVQTVSSSSELAWYLLPSSMTLRSWCHVSLGVGLVTFITPALSNYALFQIALALALTLGSIGPLYALPTTWLLQKERPTLQAVVGACLSVAGIALMSFQGTPHD